jgi:hypothetical protein
MKVKGTGLGVYAANIEFDIQESALDKYLSKNHVVIAYRKKTAKVTKEKIETKGEANETE